MSEPREILAPLSELVPGYPEDEPQYGDELYDHGLEGLSDVASALLQHVNRAIQASELPAVSSPLDALELLSAKSDDRRKLYARHRVWKTYALDRNRRLARRFQRKGVVTTHVHVTRRVPTVERLTEYLPLEDGGQYLLLYGGSASFLAVCDSTGRSVAEDIAALRAAVPVADVLFWNTEKGQTPTLWSLVAGIGDCGGDTVEFPDLEALAVSLGTSAQPTPEVKS